MRKEGGVRREQEKYRRMGGVRFISPGSPADPEPMKSPARGKMKV